jgi:hypothetical protein
MSHHQSGKKGKILAQFLCTDKQKIVENRYKFMYLSVDNEKTGSLK